MGNATPVRKGDLTLEFFNKSIKKATSIKEIINENSTNLMGMNISTLKNTFILMGMMIHTIFM